MLARAGAAVTHGGREERGVVASVADDSPELDAMNFGFATRVMYGLCHCSFMQGRILGTQRRVVLGNHCRLQISRRTQVQWQTDLAYKSRIE